MPQTPATSAAAPLGRGPIRSRLWSVALIVLGLSALLLFARLGERSLWGQEGRWSEVAREMRLSGNYFWPTINGKVYFDKPLLTYWLVVGASHLTGDVSEVAARLPSAAAGLRSRSAAHKLIIVMPMGQKKSPSLPSRVHPD